MYLEWILACDENLKEGNKTNKHNIKLNYQYKKLI
jgi:hypothetical protein